MVNLTARLAMAIRLRVLTDEEAAPLQRLAQARTAQVSTLIAAVLAKPD